MLGTSLVVLMILLQAKSVVNLPARLIFVLYGLWILVHLKYIRHEKLRFMYFCVFNIFTCVMIIFGTCFISNIRYLLGTLVRKNHINFLENYNFLELLIDLKCLELDCPIWCGLKVNLKNWAKGLSQSLVFWLSFFSRNVLSSMISLF